MELYNSGCYILMEVMSADNSKAEIVTEKLISLSFCIQHLPVVENAGLIFFFWGAVLVVVMPHLLKKIK